MDPSDSCSELLSALQNRDFRNWRGLDPACRTSAVLARFLHGEESAEVEIGSELRSARFHMLQVNGYEEPVRVVFDAENIRMIETENIEDDNGIPFLVVYGISGNTHRFWSLTNAFQKIGYQPEDDSQVRFADQTAQIARPR